MVIMEKKMETIGVHAYILWGNSYSRVILG